MNINMGTHIPAILLEGEEYWESWTTTEDETWAVTFNKSGTYIYIVEESDEYLLANIFETSNSYVQKQTPKANFKIWFKTTLAEKFACN